VTTPTHASSEFAPATPQTTAVRIHADRAAGTLAIEWADGHATTYGFEPLRWLCPCAHCRGEAGMPGWLDSDPTLTVEQTRLTEAQRHTDESLNALIAVVDDIIRRPKQ